MRQLLQRTCMRFMTINAFELNDRYHHTKGIFEQKSNPIIVSLSLAKQHGRRETRKLPSIVCGVKTLYRDPFKIPTLYQRSYSRDQKLPPRP